MNFAALDLIRRLENGQAPAVEAYKIGERWLAYSVAPLRRADNPRLQGTLLLVIDLERLLSALPALPGDVGQVQLTQKFGDGVAQVLMQRGSAGSAPPQDFNTGNPNWTLSFSAGDAQAPQALSPMMLGLAALLALAGALLGLFLTRSQLLTQLRGDVQQLGQMIQELSSGKSVKSFSLSLQPLMASRRPWRACRAAANKKP